MQLRIALVAAAVGGLTLLPTAGASAHVHGITPLLTLNGECGVTDVANTGANQAQSDVIDGLIPRDVGNADLSLGDGGFDAPVGCAD